MLVQQFSLHLCTYCAKVFFFFFKKPATTEYFQCVKYGSLTSRKLSPTSWGRLRAKKKNQINMRQILSPLTLKWLTFANFSSFKVFQGFIISSYILTIKGLQKKKKKRSFGCSCSSSSPPLCHVLSSLLTLMVSK